MLMKGRYQCFSLFPFLLKKIQVFNGYEYFFQLVKTILFIRDKSITLKAMNITIPSNLFRRLKIEMLVIVY